MKKGFLYCILLFSLGCSVTPMPRNYIISEKIDLGYSDEGKATAQEENDNLLSPKVSSH